MTILPYKGMFKITRNLYEKITRLFSQNKYFKLTLAIIYKFLPLVLFVGYPILILYVFFTQRSEIFKVVLVPLFVLIFVSVFRKLLNFKRPYEVYGIPSVFNKQTKGESFPSRHTASAFIIAMTFLYIDFDLGVTALSMAILIGLSRVLAGAHFIRDVLAGMAISILAGSIFLFIIN